MSAHLRSASYGRTTAAFPTPPRVFILRLGLVPLIDSSGVITLQQLLKRCAREGTLVILSSLREQPRTILSQMGIRPNGATMRYADNFREALALAQEAPTAPAHA